MSSQLTSCRVTEEVRLFTECLHILVETCPGSLLKRLWDTASLPLLPSEAFTAATEGDSLGPHSQASARTWEFPEPPTKPCPRPAFSVFTLTSL